MSFKEVAIFLLAFLVFYNLIDLIRSRWQVMKDKNVGISYVEFYGGFLAAFILCILFLLPVIYSYLKYEQLYGIGMAIVACMMVAICFFIITKKVYMALKVLVLLNK